MKPAPTDSTEPTKGTAEPTTNPPATGRAATEETSKEPSREQELDARHPFAHRVPLPEFPEDAEWLNSKPLKLADLRGKFVLLDFWTYCCINCMHILPELKKLERAYPNELVVIGVHSAKFDTEKSTENIAQAILRYEIEHPVFNDREHGYWETIGIQSWPTVLLIDPEGNAVWGRGGEIVFKDVDTVLKAALPYYREKKLLDETPLRFDLLAYEDTHTPLRYPGKILADEAGNRLFISDSNHNRIVVTTLDGQLVDVIGTGEIGKEDGGFGECQFHHPQGMALKGETLYVADTENHLIRKIDLAAKVVTTIAGTGVQGRVAWPGLDSLPGFGDLPKRWVGTPLKTAINSPWDLWVHDEALIIAMAGPHQIWRMPLDGSEIGPYAGNGREDIVDGPLLPEQPYGLGASSFAQPSGLTSDGQWLYVADSEGSSIRAVPLDGKGDVRTVVGTAELPYGRLFRFGDQDGPREKVLLQHCLAVAYHDGKLYVADTYNHKVKVVDIASGETQTVAGTGKPGRADDPAQFYEPAGLSIAADTLFIADTNNHRICTLDLATHEVKTLTIPGLEPPQRRAPSKPDFSQAVRNRVESVALTARDGLTRLKVRLEFPAGWKLNEQAPLDLWLEAPDGARVVAPTSLGHRSIEPVGGELEIPLAVTGSGKDLLDISLIYYYCQEDSGLCKVGTVVWQVPVTVGDAPGGHDPVITHRVEPTPLPLDTSTPPAIPQP